MVVATTPFASLGGATLRLDVSSKTVEAETSLLHEVVAIGDGLVLEQGALEGRGVVLL